MKVWKLAALAASFVVSSQAYAQQQEEVSSDPAPPMKPSACFKEEAVVWSCRDEGRIHSVCSGKADDRLTAQYRLINRDGSVELFPDGQAFFANSENVSFSETGDRLDLTLSDEDDEYVFSSKGVKGKAQFSIWRDGAVVDTLSCKLTEDNILTFAEAAEQKTYAPVKMGSLKVKAAPEAFTDIVITLKALESQGLLAMGAGMEPLSTLDGKSPKEFVWSLRDETFQCRADHGGVCASEDEVYHQFAFLKAFEGSDGTLDYTALESGKTPDLSKVSFSFKALPAPGYPVDSETEGSFCEARAYPDDWETHTNSVQAYQAQFNFTENEEYEALWNGLRAVMNQYSVYEEPSMDSKLVGMLENEMAHFPSVDVIVEAENKEWREVILPTGDAGYVAVARFDLLKIDDGGKVCATKSGATYALSDYYFGGD